MAKKPSNIWERLAPVILVATIALAFVTGVLWQKVENLAGGKTITNTNTGGAAAAQPPSPNEGKLSDEEAKKVPKVDDQDHIRGAQNPEITVIEYSDLECPFCSRFHPTLQQALKEYSGKIAWVYRHFPLDTIHPKARPAAIASECVASLSGEDKFWDFIDKIFTDQTGTLSNLVATAKAVGVNESEFSKCTSEKRFEDKINSQYQGGSGAGVSGTPGSFIVNKKGEIWFVPGAYPYESFKPIIEEALK